MTDIERTANEEARHGNRDALERMTAERDALRAKLEAAYLVAGLGFGMILAFAVSGIVMIAGG